MLCFRTLRCFENDLVLQIKEKFEGGRCCMFFPFSYFCDGCVGSTLTGSRRQHICAFLVRVTCVFFSSSFSVDCFRIHFMGRGRVPDRKVGGEEKFLLSGEWRNNITFPG